MPKMREPLEWLLAGGALPQTPLKKLTAFHRLLLSATETPLNATSISALGPSAPGCVSVLGTPVIPETLLN